MSVLLHSRETRLAFNHEIYVLQIVERDTTLSTHVSSKYSMFVCLFEVMRLLGI